MSQKSSRQILQGLETAIKNIKSMHTDRNKLLDVMKNSVSEETSHVPLSHESKAKEE